MAAHPSADGALGRRPRGDPWLVEDQSDWGCDGKKRSFDTLVHELTHAYHDRVLSYDHGGISAAFRAAVEGGRYERVLRFNGREERAYALSNDQEYFAEGTEAFFGTNDWYPFVRAELLRHDPKRTVKYELRTLSGRRILDGFESRMSS